MYYMPVCEVKKIVIKNVFKVVLLLIVPVIILVFALVDRVKFEINGEQILSIELGSTYEESGTNAYLCTMFNCKDISDSVSVVGEVNTAKVGSYIIKYIVDDSDYIERTVNVVEYEPPVILLRGESKVKVCPGKDYVEDGYTAEDNYDEDLTDKVEVFQEGDYLYYKVRDSSGNETMVDREIIYEDSEAPVLNLLGNEKVYLKLGKTYTDDGFVVVDNCDGDITNNVKVTSNVEIDKTGNYEIKYEVVDSNGNKVEAVRKVIVYDTNSLNEKFKNELTAYIEEKGYKVSVGYKNVNTGYTYSYNSSRWYYGASLIKVLDALYVYEKMNLNDELRTLVKNAISISSNSAHQKLVNKIGFNNLKNYGVSLGANNTLKGSDNFGYTTVDDQMVVLSYLYDFVNSNELGNELKQYFINDYFNYLLFPDSPVIMHKYGYYGSYFHNIGIVLDDEPYFIVILSLEGNNDFASIIQDLSKKVYELHRGY